MSKIKLTQHSLHAIEGKGQMIQDLHLLPLIRTRLMVSLTHMGFQTAYHGTEFRIVINNYCLRSRLFILVLVGLCNNGSEKKS